MAAKNKVKVNLDKERNLYFNLNALIELEDELGVPMSELSTVKISIKNIRSFLYVGLKHEDKELTPEMVGAMVDLENLPELQEKLTQAFDMSNPKN